MNIIENSKDIVKALQTLNNLDLIQKMKAFQDDYLELKEESIELKNEIKNLQEQLSIKGNLTFDGVVYKLDGEDYFCPKCYDDERKPIRLKLSAFDHGQCPKCKNDFYNIPGRPSVPQEPQTYHNFNPGR